MDEKKNTGALQFKRKPGETSRTSEVDWDEVARVLNQVDPDGTFSDPRFDPLKHALRILGSVSAEKELNELREHWIEIDALVDSAVDAHYSGFNKSLQNYSQILRLFSELMTHLSLLRRTLETSQALLKPDPSHLKELYRRDIMLADVQRLLKDIQLAMAVPDSVRKFEQREEWSLAVTTLLDGCNRVAREELTGVAALRSLKDEFSELRSSLLATLTAYIEQHVFHNDFNGNQHDHYSLHHSMTTIDGFTPPRTKPSTFPYHSSRSMNTSDSYSDNVGLLNTMSQGPLSMPRLGARTKPGHRRALTYTPGLTNSNYKELSSLNSTNPSVLSEHAPSSSTSFSNPGHLLNADNSLQTLITCVAQLSGIPFVVKSLRLHLASKIRSIIYGVLESIPKSKWLAEEGIVSASAANLIEKKRDAEAAAAVVGTIMQTVVYRCFYSFQSLTRAFQLLASARPPAASAGLRMLLVAASDNTNNNSSPITMNSSSNDTKRDQISAFEESKYAWRCIQQECQTLLTVLVGGNDSMLGIKTGGGPDRRNIVSGSGSDVPSGGWLASVGAIEAEDSTSEVFLDSGMSDYHVSEGSNSATSAGLNTPSLSFSLQGETDIALLPLTKTTNTPKNETLHKKDSKTMTSHAVSVLDIELKLSSILGGRLGRPALAVAAYIPILELVEQVERRIVDVSNVSRYEGQQEGVNTNSTTPQRSTTLLPHWFASSSTSNISQSTTLTTEEPFIQSFLDIYLRMQFLPAVYVSARGRCRALLETGDALRPRSRLRGSYTPGAAILPAAAGVVDISEEVLGWATRAPPFATQLAGVLENVLARALEAFHETFKSIVGSHSISGKLSNDVRVVQIMAKEPSAPLMGPPVSFFVGGNVDAIDSFVSSAIAAGFGSSQKSLDRELVGQLLNDIGGCNVSQQALLAAGGEPTHLIHLAALAESADYVADAIHRAATAAAFNHSSSGPRRAEVWNRYDSKNNNGSRNQLDDEPMSGGMDRGFAEGIAHVADKYRAFAGRCIRTLRIELILLAIQHFEVLPRFMAAGAIAHAAEEHVASLARVVSQLDDALCPYLPLDRRMYVFGSLPPAVVQIAVSLLPQFSSIDNAGISKVNRVLSALQPVLCAAGGVGEGPAIQSGPGMPDPSRQLEKAKFYYSLLNHSVDSLLANVAQKPKRFSVEEYSALLSVSVPGRKVSPEQKQQLRNIVMRATG